MGRHEICQWSPTLLIVLVFVRDALHAAANMVAGHSPRPMLNWDLVSDFILLVPAFCSHLDESSPFLTVAVGMVS